MELTLSRNWREIKQPSVVELGTNTFSISFKSGEEKQKIWESRPWKIADALLVLIDWKGKGKIKIEELNFNKTIIWVQIHNFPGELRSEENVATPLNEIFKEIIRGDEMGVAEGKYVSFIRVLVGIDLSEPLAPGFFLQDDAPPDIWVEFKYERLPENFCYSCGRIGHSQLMCNHPEERVEGRYGEWTRAGHHSPPSPLSCTPVLTPGTAESKTGDNFSSSGDRSVGRLLDGRLSGGRGPRGKGRREEADVRTKTPLHMGTTARLPDSRKETDGPPPGFGLPRPTGAADQLLRMKYADDCSPYQPRKLSFGKDQTDEEGGCTQNQREAGQGSGSRVDVGMGMGLSSPSPYPNLLNPLMGQQSLFPSPNYLNMYQENMFLNQAQLPFLMWDNNQNKAQFLSPWGLKSDQPRKKIKVTRKRKNGGSTLEVEGQYGSQAAAREFTEEEDGTGYSEEMVAEPKPSGHP
ncbi:unnamed protein product [Linum trigynum]